MRETTWMIEETGPSTGEEGFHSLWVEPEGGESRYELRVHLDTLRVQVLHLQGADDGIPLKFLREFLIHAATIAKNARFHIEFQERLNTLGIRGEMNDAVMDALCAVQSQGELAG